MIAHKTKATMPGRLSHTALLKRIQITWLAAGGQTLRSPVLASSNPLKQHCVILVLNKTKAALHGGQCQSTKLIQAQHNTLIDLVKRQPFGSMPRCCSSFLMMRFIQAETDASPSCANACFIPASNSGSTRKAICLLPFPLILMVDIWLTPDYLDVVIKCMTGAYQKATPRSVSPLPRRLTTNAN